GAAIEGAILAEGVAVADLEHGRLALVADVLRSLAERAELEDPVVPPDARRSVHDHVRADPGAVGGPGVGPDDRVGADLDALPETRARIDHRRRMHGGRSHMPLYVHISSALQHTSPSTDAAASNSQMPFILRLTATSMRN